MKNRIGYIPAILFLIFAAGCAAQSSGETDDSSTAPPSVTPPVPPVDISGENNFRYAQTAKTPSGWSLTYDSAEPNEHVVLPSGWEVEVKYE